MSRVRGAVLVCLLCASCRQLLGLDQPVRATADASGADSGEDGAPADASGVRFVQAGSGLGGSAGTVQLAAGTAGDLDFVAVYWIPSSATATVTDGDGNTYVAIGQLAQGMTVSALFYAANIRQGSGPNTITAQLSVAGETAVIAAEYRGLATAMPLDTYASASGSAATADCGALATTHAHDLIVATVDSGKALTPGATYTERESAFAGEILLEDSEVETTGEYDATATLAGSGSWLCNSAAFEAILP